MYMEEAVDAIIKALDASLTNKNIREICCKAILILGGHFSLPEKFGSSILKETGFINSSEVNSLDCKEELEMGSKVSLVSYSTKLSFSTKTWLFMNMKKHPCDEQYHVRFHHIKDLAIFLVSRWSFFSQRFYCSFLEHVSWGSIYVISLPLGWTFCLVFSSLIRYQCVSTPQNKFLVESVVDH